MPFAPAQITKAGDVRAMMDQLSSSSNGPQRPADSTPGDRPRRDSTASSAPLTDRLVLHNAREDIEQVSQNIISAIESRRYDPASCFAIRLALEEALTNAFRHGNNNDPQKIVTIEYRVDERSVVIDVEDQGQGFDPQSVPDPTADENLEIPSGRGLVLMRSFMTDVEFRPPGNRVRMRYERPRCTEH